MHDVIIKLQCIKSSFRTRYYNVVMAVALTTVEVFNLVDMKLNRVFEIDKQVLLY